VSDGHDWRDATMIGSSYVEQLCIRTGAWRHRRMTLMLGEEIDRTKIRGWSAEEWKPGKAPNREGAL
jgi:hypothetical protein